jgi:signal peptidase I
VSLQRVLFGRNPRRTTVRILVLAAISFSLFRWVLIPVRTDGVSMMPTYESGSLRLVNKLSFRGGKRPDRGDIVAIKLAGPHVLYVKRIVGLPGERIAVAGGLVQVNGHPLLEPYVQRRKPWDYNEVTLGPREYFVIGDNRSAVSRGDFGRVDASRIVGKLLF